MIFPSHLERRVEAMIQSRLMLNGDDRVIAAVSGGPDSVALVAILESLRANWGFKLWAVHLDHGLRGVESQGDARFVKQLCEELGVDVTMRSLEIKKVDAQKNGLSLQEYAREKRYTALYDMAKEVGATKIALGHTAEDQAETVLMWMIRGAGTGGLGGIPPLYGSYLIRPLLEITRTEILSYLSRRGLEYRIDSTNLKPIYLRNRIRQELVPILKRFNPSLLKVLSRQADIVREDHYYLDQLAMEALDRVIRPSEGQSIILHREGLLALPLALRRRVVGLVLQRIGQLNRHPRFTAVERVLAQVVDGKSGSYVTLPRVWVTREFSEIRFQIPAPKSNGPYPFITESQCVPIPSQVGWPLTGQTLEVSLEGDPPKEISGDPQHAWLDIHTFSASLVVRTWQPGDQFCPLGLGGQRKKLQDFFSDIKLERSKRSRVPLLVAPEGILWVGGYRLDHRFRMTESTKEVLMANLSPHTQFHFA